MAARKRLGDLLVEAGLIDQYQLQSALGHQRQWGGPIGRILVDNGFVSETRLAEVLAAQMNLPLIDLDQQEIHEKVIGEVPQDMAERYRMVPVRIQQLEARGALIYLAMADPTNVEAIDAIQFKTGKRVSPLLATESAIDRAVRRYYYGEQPRELTPPHGHVQFGGQEIDFGGPSDVQFGGHEIDLSAGAPAPARTPTMPMPGVPKPAPAMMPPAGAPRPAPSLQPPMGAPTLPGPGAPAGPPAPAPAADDSWVLGDAPPPAQASPSSSSAALPAQPAPHLSPPVSDPPILDLGPDLLEPEPPPPSAATAWPPPAATSAPNLPAVTSAPNHPAATSAPNHPAATTAEHLLATPGQPPAPPVSSPPEPRPEPARTPSGSIKLSDLSSAPEVAAVRASGPSSSAPTLSAAELAELGIEVDAPSGPTPFEAPSPSEQAPPPPAPPPASTAPTQSAPMPEPAPAASTLSLDAALGGGTEEDAPAPAWGSPDAALSSDWASLASDEAPAVDAPPTLAPPIAEGEPPAPRTWEPPVAEDEPPARLPTFEPSVAERAPAPALEPSIAKDVPPTLAPPTFEIPAGGAEPPASAPDAPRADDAPPAPAVGALAASPDAAAEPEPLAAAPETSPPSDDAPTEPLVEAAPPAPSKATPVPEPTASPEAGDEDEDDVPYAALDTGEFELIGEPDDEDLPPAAPGHVAPAPVVEPVEPAASVEVPAPPLVASVHAMVPDDEGNALAQASAASAASPLIPEGEEGPATLDAPLEALSAMVPAEELGPPALVDDGVRQATDVGDGASTPVVGPPPPAAAVPPPPALGAPPPPPLSDAPARVNPGTSASNGVGTTGSLPSLPAPAPAVAHTGRFVFTDASWLPIERPPAHGTARAGFADRVDVLLGEQAPGVGVMPTYTVPMLMASAALTDDPLTLAGGVASVPSPIAPALRGARRAFGAEVDDVATLLASAAAGTIAPAAAPPPPPPPPPDSWQVAAEQQILTERRELGHEGNAARRQRFQEVASQAAESALHQALPEPMVDYHSADGPALADGVAPWASLVDAIGEVEASAAPAEATPSPSAQTPASSLAADGVVADGTGADAAGADAAAADAAAADAAAADAADADAAGADAADADAADADAADADAADADAAGAEAAPEREAPVSLADEPVPLAGADEPVPLAGGSLADAPVPLAGDTPDALEGMELPAPPSIDDVTSPPAALEDDAPPAPPALEDTAFPDAGAEMPAIGEGALSAPSLADAPPAPAAIDGFAELSLADPINSPAIPPSDMAEVTAPFGKPVPPMPSIPIELEEPGVHPASTELPETQVAADAFNALPSTELAPPAPADLALSAANDPFGMPSADPLGEPAEPEPPGGVASATGSVADFGVPTPTMITKLSKEQLRALASRLVDRGALTAEDYEAAKGDDEDGVG